MNFSTQNLYTQEGLQEIDKAFLIFLKDASCVLYEAYESVRFGKEISPQEESKLLLELAPFVESFLAKIFSIEKEVFDLQKSLSNLAPLFQCRRLFVQRRALKKYSAEESKDFEGLVLEKHLLSHMKIKEFNALAFSEYILHCLKEADDYEKEIDLAEKYTAWRVFHIKEDPLSLSAQLFRVPQKIDFQNLIETSSEREGERKLSPEFLKSRSGFDLTDFGKNSAYACGEAHYCIFCHKQGKDWCSKGFPEKEKSAAVSFDDQIDENKKKELNENFQKNPLGVELKGCPLKQKISEMNVLVSEGYMLGALAMVIIDNPLVAATGARICNDCMRSCIYQKQESVDIPNIETEVFKNVIELPWGFEIYSLLTRWNPLNIKNILPKALTHYKILVVGMGPAGFTLSHYLLNQGHTIVGIDGLKIEPLPSSLIGHEKEFDFELIKDVKDLFSNLSERLIGGFGGVMEYGITSRWNKNYLLLIRLLLERRKSQFTLLGSTRFGGAFDEKYALELGFNHISLCLGAGEPRLLKLEKSLAKGIRQASDFLMTLHLGGASQKNSLTNFVIRLPIIVLGGGLTAVDTATEAQAYYRGQVETFLIRYETLLREKGKECVEKFWDLEDKEIAAEFIQHGILFRQEEERAKSEGRAPNFHKLIQSWGGIHVAYRRSLEEAPAYRFNAEELKKAFEEGICFLENIEILSLKLDETDWLSEMMFQQKEKTLTRPVKTILVAYGTRPNTSIIEAGEVSLPLKNGQLIPLLKEDLLEKERQESYAPLICQMSAGLSMSFLGDLNPKFSGSVVKAMASAKEGAPLIDHLMRKNSFPKKEREDFSTKIKKLFEASIVDLQEIAPNILEITVHAPHAARAFQPGQFFRLQRYEAFSLHRDGTRFSMEGIALTGASACPQSGTLSLIVLEVGASTKLCRLFKKGERIALMGPTGSPTKIFPQKTVLLIGGGLGNAVLFSVGKAFRESGSRVLYIAGYKSLKDRFKIKEIEAAANTVLWCVEDLSSQKDVHKRPQDLVFQGRVTDALIAYAKGEMGEPSISLEEVDYILTVGSQEMMEAVSHVRNKTLKSCLASKKDAYGSINSPMQCMMKGICAQCLQRQYDPLTGLETIIFSCRNQDQLLDYVDFECLKNRLKQNNLLEDIALQWGEFLKVF
ncbi:MAG: pyridine nucleotide-disulfide oxidoreductase [Proteobacteria bacterium]|nr:pyridine nucleotide-disulfide oxidoreductase [Pseudomonadota bacterium]